MADLLGFGYIANPAVPGSALGIGTNNLPAWINPDGTAATPSMRTLGTGATQAYPGATGAAADAVLAQLDGIDLTVPGWVNAPAAWVYVSATSFKEVGVDTRNRYPVGTKLSCTDSTTKFGYAGVATYAGGDTTVPFLGGSGYVLSGGAITNPRYSYMATPQGFPGGFAYTPTYGGWAATPTLRGEFTINGRLLTAWLYAGGTSAAGATTLTIPISVSALLPDGSGTGFGSFGRGQDNGGAATAIMARPAASSATVTFYKDLAATAFTTSGDKKVEATFSVPI